MKSDKTTRSRRIPGMGRVLLLFLAVSLVFMGYSPPGARGSTGGNPPEFVDSFAVSSIWPGQDWRIFVRGDDPDGQMDYIWIVVSQLGGNMWSNHLVRLKGEERKHFAGYITLPTPRFFPRSAWQYVTVEMKIKDNAGRYSEKRTHEVEIGSPTQQTLPTEWRSVANRNLGTIFFDFDLDQGESHGLKR